MYVRTVKMKLCYKIKFICLNSSDNWSINVPLELVQTLLDDPRLTNIHMYVYCIPLLRPNNKIFGKNIFNVLL